MKREIGSALHRLALCTSTVGLVATGNACDRRVEVVNPAGLPCHGAIKLFVAACYEVCKDQGLSWAAPDFEHMEQGVGCREEKLTCICEPTAGAKMLAGWQMTSPTSAPQAAAPLPVGQGPLRLTSLRGEWYTGFSNSEGTADRSLLLHGRLANVDPSETYVYDLVGELAVGVHGKDLQRVNDVMAAGEQLSQGRTVDVNFGGVLTGLRVDSAWLGYGVDSVHVKLSARGKSPFGKSFNVLLFEGDVPLPVTREKFVLLGSVELGKPARHTKSKSRGAAPSAGDADLP